MHSFNARQRRNLLDLNVSGFAPIHFPLTNYSTDSVTQSKEEMKHTYGDTLFFNNLHLIPDPLKKNLADSVITGEENKKPNMVETKESGTPQRPQRPQRPDYYPSLAGITSFFSGVLNVMGAIFQKRPTSPTSQYYDCFENYNDQQVAPPPWQSSNIEVQNKNERDPFSFACNNEVNTNLVVEMSADCRSAANHCEDKLNQVRLLLNNKSKINEKLPKARSNRPRKAFIEAGSVEESFQDAFLPEECNSLASDTFIEYYSPYNRHNEEFIHAEAPKVKTEMCVKEPIDIVNSFSTEIKEKENNESTVINDNSFVTTEVVSSCEDKLSKLKALLNKNKKDVNNKQELAPKESETSDPIPIPVHKPVKLEHNNIPNETVFGNELKSTELQSSQESNYFNEVTGKFFASSVESDDSFQIVFSDSPPNCRRRIPSDCESEDSFIVFEESPDSCYTSHDVFCAYKVDDNHSDSDSDVEEDSGITCKLAHNLSRTFGDLTDDSLYSQDVVDSAQVCNEITNDVVSEPEVLEEESGGCKSLLLSEKRKSEKRKLPPKKVTFSTQPPKVHVMRVWAFAARQARAGQWERLALDRERFKRRIADVEMAISWVFKRQHRTRIVFQRFRPWWNAERRRELAEKKEKEREKEEREKEEKEKEEREKEEKDEEEIKTQNDKNNVVEVTEDLIDNTGKVNDVSKDIDCIDDTTNEKSADLNGFVEENDEVRTKQVVACNGLGNDFDDVNSNKGTRILNKIHNAELPPSKEALFYDNNTLEGCSNMIVTNNSKDAELNDYYNNITPESKETIKTSHET